MRCTKDAETGIRISLLVCWLLVVGCFTFILERLWVLLTFPAPLWWCWAFILKVVLRLRFVGGVLGVVIF